MSPAILEAHAVQAVDQTPIATSKASQLSSSSTISTFQSGARDYTEPVLLHRSLLEHPYQVESASGIYLNLQDGRQIMDACGGAAVAIIGHGNEEVIRATTVQMMKVSYVHTLSYTTDSAENLAKALLAGNKYGLEKAYFVGSGSEANDAAMKLGRQFFFEQGQTQRKHFVSRRQGYHGNTIGTMSISSNLARKIPYQDALTLPNVSQVSPAYAYQYQLASENEEQYVARLVDELDAEFKRIGPEKVIAFIAEPVVGATTGCVTAPKGYFHAVRRLCGQYGILLILDEVMCGMGRTGTYFAFEQEDVIPDIVIVGKGLGGGYAPIAGVLIHKKVIDVLRKGTSSFNHGHTYQAHPVTCATALSVQRIVKREGLVKRCAQMGNVLERLLRAELEGCKYVGDIRGRGLFWGIEFVKNRSSKTPLDPSIHFGLKVQRAAFELGVAIYPGGNTVDGVRGDHVLLAPPYTVTEVQLEKIVQVLRQAYDAEEKLADELFL